jgi:hypothetical protein
MSDEAKMEIEMDWNKTPEEVQDKMIRAGRLYEKIMEVVQRHSSDDVAIDASALMNALGCVLLHHEDPPAAARTMAEGLTMMVDHNDARRRNAAN